MSSTGFPVTGSFNGPVAAVSANGMVNTLYSGSSNTVYMYLYANAISGGYSTLGNTFTGYVWVTYNTGTVGGISDANNAIAAKAATLTAKVV